MAGTRKAELTRWRATRSSQTPASNRGCTTVVSPAYRPISRPSTPPTWNDGTHMIATFGASVRVERLPVGGQPGDGALMTDRHRLGQAGGAAGEQHQRVVVASARQRGRPVVRPGRRGLLEHRAVVTEGLGERKQASAPAIPTGAQPDAATSPASSVVVSSGFIWAVAAPR